jgi:hypothetical protein
MKDFLQALARRVKRNGNALDIFRRLYTAPPDVPASPSGSPLQTKVRGNRKKLALCPLHVGLAGIVFQARRSI